MIVHKPVKRDINQSNFRRLAHYITRDFSKESIVFQKTTNCISDDPQDALKEIEAIQSKNTRTTQDKTYHLIISFPQSEKPDKEQLADIEQQLCESIGYGKHQRISALHEDTEHLHLHLAINKIDPETHNIIQYRRDFNRLNEKAAELEVKYDLKRVCGLNKDGTEVLKEQKEYKKKNATIESQTGLQSFKDWIHAAKPDLLPKVQAATNWQDLHKTLAQYDLTIRPHANGLSISSRTQKAYIKASDFDRNTTLKKLEDRLGKYQEPTNDIKDITPTLQYKPSPKQTGNDVNSQFALYQQQHQTKKAALEAIKEARKQASAKLAKDYQERRESIKKDRLLNVKSKRRTYQLLKQTYQQDKIRLSADFKQQSDAIYHQHPAKNWQDWLVHQATQGDKPALDTLRQNKPANSKPVERFAVWGEQEKQGMHILKRLKPRVQKNGDVLYQAMGVKIRDTGKRLALDSNQESAIITALRLAQSKYGNHLDVQGDVDFKQKVVEAAAATGMNVTFADPEMEKRRQHLKQRQPVPLSPANPKTRTTTQTTRPRGGDGR